MHQLTNTNLPTDFVLHGSEHPEDVWLFSLTKDGIWNLGMMSAGIQNGHPCLGPLGLVTPVEEENLLAILRERGQTRQIAEVIDSDIAQDRGDLIHHIRMDFEIALGLFLEGTITPDNIRQAMLYENERQTPQAAWYIIPNVVFETKLGPRSFDLLLIDLESAKQFESSLATVDRDGKTV